MEHADPQSVCTTVMKLPALCPSEQAARASAVGRSRCQQLNGVVQQADKNLDSICVKVESEEVDARIRAVRHNRCRVPLRLALTKRLSRGALFAHSHV